MKWATVEQQQFFIMENCRKVEKFQDCENCLFYGKNCETFNITTQEELLEYNEIILKYWNEHKK